jgi:hypothetical protein
MASTNIYDPDREISIYYCEMIFRFCFYQWR